MKSRVFKTATFICAYIISGNILTSNNSFYKLQFGNLPECFLSTPKKFYNKAVDTPNILFAFNSTQIYREKDEDQKTYEQKCDIVVERLKRIFNEETSTVIEVSGHCDSRELNPDKLSLARAKYISDALVKKGISKNRIVIKGYGNKQPLIPDATIKSAKTKEEKEEWYLQNRRITIKILRWDYKE